MVSSGPPARVALGRVSKPHGLKGEVVVTGTPLSADELRELSPLVGRDAAGNLRPLAIVATRPFLHQVLVRFEGVEDRAAAQALAGLDLEVDPARLPKLGRGEVYIYELLGLAVATDAGQALGRVHDVLRTGATPILVVWEDVAPGGGRARERLLPMSPDILLEVDVPAGRVVVRLLPGMEDL